MCNERRIKRRGWVIRGYIWVCYLGSRYKRGIKREQNDPPICRRNVVMDCMSLLLVVSMQQAMTEGLNTQSTARVVGLMSRRGPTMMGTCHHKSSSDGTLGVIKTRKFISKSKRKLLLIIKFNITRLSMRIRMERFSPVNHRRIVISTWLACPTPVHIVVQTVVPMQHENKN